MTLRNYNEKSLSYQKGLIEKYPVGGHDYIEQQTRVCYRFERNFIKPFFKNFCKDTFIPNSYSDFENQSHSKQLKIFIKNINEYISHFCLGEVKQSISKKKNGNSYYSREKNKIFVNSFYFENPNFKDNEWYLDILYVFIHEYVHAYVDKYYSEEEMHSSLFFNILIEHILFFTGKTLEELIKQKDREGNNLEEELKYQRFLSLDNDFFYKISFQNEKDFFKYKENLKKNNIPFEDFDNIWNKESDTILIFKENEDYHNSAEGRLYKEKGLYFLYIIDIIKHIENEKRQDSIFIENIEKNIKEHSNEI